MSTRLYHRMCDAQGLCYDVSGTYDGYEDDGVVDLSAGVQHARAAQVTRELLDMMTELAQEGPTEEEIVKARKRRQWELTSMQDSAEEMGVLFGTGVLFDRLLTPAELHARISKPTRDDVVAIARAIVRPDRLNIVAVGMLEGGEDKRLRATVKEFGKVSWTA